jgi:hemerythrin-like domain-containing protein
MPELCQSLVREHEIIERVLNAMEHEAAKIDNGAAVERYFFSEVIAFVREFADGVHHHKEEAVLFPRMVAAGLPKEGGPIAVMLEDHEIGRAHIRAMSGALDQAIEGDANARRSLIGEARGYVSLLRAHIQKENNILFPMADHIFDPVAKATIHSEFSKAEAKNAVVTEKRRRWAESLATTLAL